MTPTNHNARRERIGRFCHVVWLRHMEQGGGDRHDIDKRHVVDAYRWDTIWALQHYRAERRASK